MDQDHILLIIEGIESYETRTNEDKMVKDFNYDTIARVIETWEEAKRVPNFENVAGTAVLLRCVAKRICR